MAMRDSSYALAITPGLRIVAAAAIAFPFCCASASRVAGDAETVAAEPPSRLIADATATNGAKLCLAADADRPLKGPFSIPPATAAGKAHLAAGPFYPVIAAACDSVGASASALWTPTAVRELRIKVKGEDMCLSARLMTNFLPLVDPFLDAFKASQPGSPFDYLAEDLKPQGKVDARRVDFNPELVVGACGLSDAQDFWVYDDPSGTISGPGGFGRRRQCVTIHADRRSSNTEIPAGTPVAASNCPDSPDRVGETIATFDRASLPAVQRWRLETGKENRPTYLPFDAQDYFSGKHGLPIAGPMGRCLTADFPRQSAVTSDCDGRIEQDWKMIGNTFQLASAQECLTAGADGAASLATCAQARNQQWAYTVKEPAASRAWLSADLFGQIRPLDDPTRCLAVVDDPFKDTSLQRNPVHVVACESVLPRQMSWFVATQIYTIRVALVRYGHEPDHMPMPKMSDDELKSIFADQIVRLSAEYRRVGVRFVFDPDHDFRRIDNPAADRGKNDPTFADGLAKVAADDLYGKITLALVERANANENTAWNVEYEPDRIADPISGGKFNYSGWKQDSVRVLDKAGLPALSDFIEQGGGMGFDLAYGGRLARDFGHYFGLLDKFHPDEFADVPDDVGSVKSWADAGAPPCGNLRSAAINSKTYTPDRFNNESEWGCAIGRSLNAFSPMQLAKASWVMRSQLNRIPLVSCAPAGAYNADIVKCEDAASLALCKETAAFLSSKTGGESLSCRQGGAIQRDIALAMKYVGMDYVFKKTPQGQAFINALAGLGATAKPVSDKTYSDVAAALASGRNIPLAKAILNRIAEFHESSARDHNHLYMDGFTEHPKDPLNAVEMEALDRYSATIITPGFIANVPVISR
jgi:hypothetical protein